MEKDLDSKILNKKYQPGYVSELLDPTMDCTYLLYQYGPFLVREYLDRFWDHIDKITHQTLLHMVFCGKIYDLTTNKYTYREVKDVIKQIRSLNQENLWSSNVCDALDHLEKQIDVTQKQTYSLENAMTSMAPIVCYGGSGFLRKAELSQEYQSTIPAEDTYPELKRAETLDNVMLCLRMNGLPIAKYPDLFITNENQAKRYIDIVWHGNNEESDKDKLSAMLYFVKVYIHFSSTEEANHSMESLIKLNTAYNNMHNGKRFDVSDIVGVFESLIPDAPH